MRAVWRVHARGVTQVQGEEKECIVNDEDIERRCSHCFDRIRQTRLDAEEDDFCSERCSEAWLAFWAAAKSVQAS